MGRWLSLIYPGILHYHLFPNFQHMVSKINEVKVIFVFTIRHFSLDRLIWFLLWLQGNTVTISVYLQHKGYSHAWEIITLVKGWCKSQPITHDYDPKIKVPCSFACMITGSQTMANHGSHMGLHIEYMDLLVGFPWLFWWMKSSFRFHDSLRPICILISTEFQKLVLLSRPM